MKSARNTYRYPGSFEMHRGGVLESPSVVYETWGELSPEADNAVMIFTGLSPSAHATSSPLDPAPGWWEEMVGPSRPIDTRCYYVICVNSLGSCFGSTGPASISPATGEPYRLGFPVLSLEDIATMGRHVLLDIGVKRLAGLVGPSMGGMTAQAYAAMYPGTYERILLMSTASRAQPFSIALRSMQRELIRRDPDWNDGNYEPGKGPIQGMRMARKLGMMTYRSAAEWEQRFGRERIPAERKSGDGFAMDFEIESYLEAHANKFIGQFDANCYLYLSRASDLFDIAEHGGSIKAGLARIDAPRSMVIGVPTDLLFPVQQQREIADALKLGNGEVEYVEIDSIHGHDSFLVDMDQFRPPIKAFFDK